MDIDIEFEHAGEGCVLNPQEKDNIQSLFRLSDLPWSSEQADSPLYPAVNVDSTIDTSTSIIDTATTTNTTTNTTTTTTTSTTTTTAVSEISQQAGDITIAKNNSENNSSDNPSCSKTTIGNEADSEHKYFNSLQLNELQIDTERVEYIQENVEEMKQNKELPEQEQAQQPVLEMEPVSEQPQIQENEVLINGDQQCDRLEHKTSTQLSHDGQCISDQKELDEEDTYIQTLSFEEAKQLIKYLLQERKQYLSSVKT